jgi:hypothetical protein
MAVSIKRLLTLHSSSSRNKVNKKGNSSRKRTQTAVDLKRQLQQHLLLILP